MAEIGLSPQVSGTGGRFHPRTRDHKAVHAHLTNQIQDLALELHRGQVDLSPPIPNLLEGWLICHIQYEDRHLVQHLLKNSR